MYSIEYLLYEKPPRSESAGGKQTIIMKNKQDYFLYLSRTEMRISITSS